MVEEGRQNPKTSVREQAGNFILFFRIKHVPALFRSEPVVTANALNASRIDNTWKFLCEFTNQELRLLIFQINSQNQKMLKGEFNFARDLGLVVLRKKMRSQMKKGGKIEK